MGWPSVRQYKDGDKVNAEALNGPINQLTERTEQLYRMLKDNDRTKVVVSAEIRLPVGFGLPYVGMPVYRTATGAYAPASATEQQNAWFYASDAAMAVGVVSKVISSTETTAEADVVLYGEIEIAADTDLPAATIIADDDPASGRYYLSATAGKLTARPVGPVIYVCNVLLEERKGVRYVRSILVSPQYRDTGESHVHRQVVLSGLPAGGTASIVDDKYVAGGIAARSETGTATARLTTYGHWDGAAPITYEVTVRGTALTWTSDDPDGDSGSTTLVADGPTTVGRHGLAVRVTGDGTWDLEMPNVAKGWMNYSEGGTQVGYALNLQMYLNLDGSAADPNPLNGAYLSVDGVERRGPVFEDRKQWKVVASLGGADGSEGPWLIWYGCAVDNKNAVAPFILEDDGTVVARDILFTTNTMRVGPTGFVTALQAAPGSILKFTRMGTSFPAAQGPLQADLGIDFNTETGGVRGHEVVKRIVGSTFYTGPVVERVVAGPGAAVLPSHGQGTVTVALGGAKFAGDFETIALKNAKQDVAGGIFPYTKLLGPNEVASGFTAKFRVPDYLPYLDADGNPIDYNVIVSASLFGEAASEASAQAAFRLRSFYLYDYALTPDATAIPPVGGASINQPTPGDTVTVPVVLGENYAAFDPVVVHGFPPSIVPDVIPHRRNVPDLLLKKDGQAIVVRPGYFVGLEIFRANPAGSGVQYTAPLGFLSLRWNLVDAREVA